MSMKLEASYDRVEAPVVLGANSASFPTSEGLMSAVLLSASRIIDTEHERLGTWMHAQGAGRWRQGATCIGLERHGEIVASAMFDWYNGASIFAHIAVTGRISHEWLHRICHYPFVQLQCQVVIGLVSSTNLAAQRFDEHFGFQKQVTLPGADTHGDLLIYTLQKADCRFITRRHYGKV